MKGSGSHQSIGMMVGEGEPGHQKEASSPKKSDLRSE